MPQLLTGKVAIVTGAGSGLGKAHALALAAHGASVVVNDLAQPAAESTVALIESAGGVAVADHNSVSSPEGGQAIIRAAVENFRTVHILVNNAGVLIDSPFSSMELAVWSAVIDVHLNGAFYVTRPAWEVMAGQGYGRIVFTTSASGIFGNSGHANYGAAKMGVFGLSRMLAVEGFPLNIKSNAIAPLAWTPMSQGGGSRTRAVDVMGELFRRLDPAMVSPLVVLLSSEGCPVSGETYSIGGGRIARIFVAETEGVAVRTLAVEEISAQLPQIRSTERFSIPASMADELALYSRVLVPNTGSSRSASD